MSTGKKAQNKGKRGELLLVHFLESMGLVVKRGYVWLNQSDLVGLDGIHIECKFVEALNVRKALNQAIEEAEKKRDGLPTVFWKASRKEWVTVMRTEDWVKLYKMARGEIYKRDTERADFNVYEDE